MIYYPEVICLLKMMPMSSASTENPYVLGIASRAIKPTLGLIDPLHTLHMPARVVANSGFDVLW